MSATAQLPTLDLTVSATVDVQGGITGFAEVLGSLGSGSGGSPLAAVGTALQGLEGRLDVDMSGLSEGLPRAITTIRNALPADALRYVEEIEAAYRALMEFLAESEVAKQVRNGSSLELTALAVVDDVLRLFRTRLGELASRLVGAEELDRVRAALALIDDLRQDFEGNAGELLPFLSQNLVGVPADLLAGATAQVEGSLAFLEPVSEASLSLHLAPLRAALDAAAAEVAEAVAAFDPADASLYAALELKLEALGTATDAAFDGLEALYAALGVVVESDAWDAVFTGYATVLNALPLEAIPTLDDVVGEIGAVLDNLLSSLTMAFSPEELAARIALLSTRVETTFAQSPLGQARQIILDFLGDIVEAIEAVPTEQVQEAVTGMLQRVKAELDALGIGQVRGAIEQGFQEAEAFIDETLDDDLFQQVEDALAGVLAQLEELPIAEVGAQLTQAVDAVGNVVQELETSLADGIEQVRGLLAQLDEVSFRPVADEVLEEINTLRTKLAAIKPEALSDAERFALTGALALLRAIDLEGLIVGELKVGFGSVANEVKGVVNQVIAAWEDLRRRIGGFDPEAVTGPLGAALDEVTATVERLNATLILSPLYDQVAAMRAGLESLSPGALLDPLQAPYAEMMALVRRADPAVWVEPLRALHAEIDRMVGYVDITPLMDTLEEKERELFAQARQAIVDGLDSVSLPPPLDVFYAQVKVVTLALSDAVFGDPEEGIRAVNLSVRENVKLSSLFAPLDAAFDELLAMLDGVPHDDLVEVMEALRTGLGAALPALDPRRVIARMREGQARIAALGPARAAASIPALPALRGSLELKLEAAPAGQAAAAASLRGRFDLVVAPVRPDHPASRLRALQAAHDELAASMRRKINDLEATGAQAAYARLDANLGRLLPAFLRQPTPLTYEDIRAGLAELRPSYRARRLDAGVELFIARLKPMEGALEPAIDGFFRIIRESALLIHPGTLRDAVADVYTALRAKLHVLDPDELAGELRASVYDPLVDPLLAIDPAAIKAQLDAVYRHLLTTLTGRVTGFIDQVKTALDAVLREARQALTSVLAALRAQITAIVAKLAGIMKKLDSLVLDDLFGRLLNMIDNLEASFGAELDRVRNGFDAMLDAIPLGGSATVSASVSL